MRLYGMYYMCKEYIGLVKTMQVESRNENAVTIKFINGWKEKSQILNEIAKIPPLRENALKVYETIPTMYRDKDSFDIAGKIAEGFIARKRDLMTAMDTVIKVYEAINIEQEKTDGGFDIKFPAFENIKEFSRCLEDLDFVINQCPYLRRGDCEIKYGSVDVGSTWMTFLLIGSAASALLFNLSKLVDAAIKIKSHATTVKMQEEELRSMELKNDIADEVINAFKRMNRGITDRSIAELQQEIGELKDGEEIDKTRMSLEKLALWMDKGMQIYSTIDAPSEIKDLFPAQIEATYLMDNLQKLIEMKKEEK